MIYLKRRKPVFEWKIEKIILKRCYTNKIDAFLDCKCLVIVLLKS